MMLSKLIEQLQEKLKARGDMEVVMRLETGYCAPVMSIGRFDQGSFGGECTVISRHTTEERV
jgi:hypothetical protein